ncbi:MAG: HAD hydrolase-like protein [Lentisphaeria bacterium]|nr:HAD hydrolase-like protein [Lentisphaeria bacterium]
MIKLAVFDFDGTIADSVDFCLYAFERTFEKFMDKIPQREDIYQCFGMNEPGVIRHFIGRECPEAEEYFYKIHREMHPEKCPDCLPGVRELLDYIKSKNIRMALLTGRSETTAQISMECLNIGDYFSDFLYGSPAKTDKTPQMLSLLEKYNLQCDEMVYIGDAVSDVQSSQRANVRCLTAAWAKTARIGELEKMNPGLVFRTVGEMRDFLEKNG